jgi:hypothetical protein
VKSSIAFLLLIVAVIAVSALFRAGGKPALQPVSGLPWQIEILPNGETRVFDLIPAHSSLDDARRRFGMDMQIAVIAAPGESGSLEAYSGSVTTGAIMGKMILVAAMDEREVAHLRQRAVKSEYMDSSTRKYILHHDDLAHAWQAPIASITFIPAASLDEQTVLGRFGTPTERIRVDDRVEHFLYPQKGLDLALDSKGKEVLQYVSPRQFARLREPLIKATPVTTPHP